MEARERRVGAAGKAHQQDGEAGEGEGPTVRIDEYARHIRAHASLYRLECSLPLPRVRRGRMGDLLVRNMVHSGDCRLWMLGSWALGLQHFPILGSRTEGRWVVETEVVEKQWLPVCEL
jgi:hypothetical protein